MGIKKHTSMKAIKYMILAFMGAAVFAACDDKIDNIEPAGYTGAPQTLDASAVTYDSLPGSIKLKWQKPANETYEYMKISYVNPATNETVTDVVSKYCDSLVINNTLRKYGDYTFTFQAYNAQNEKGAATVVKAMSGRAVATVIINKTKVTLTADQLSTDDQEPSEGPLKNIIDGDANTFFHSRWSSPQKNLPQYIQIDFKESHKNFAIWYKNRNGSQVGPQAFELQTSADGTNWETVATMDSNLPSGSKAEYTSDAIRPANSFTHFRFVVTKTYGNVKYFNMAEFAFYDAEIIVNDPEK
jgi:hypothetical protein